jgi:hypothetical protein
MLWQLNNPKAEGWAKKLKEELERIGFAYIFGKARQRVMQISYVKCLEKGAMI